jgi:hypothetical protein
VYKEARSMPEERKVNVPHTFTRKTVMVKATAFLHPVLSRIYGATTTEPRAFLIKTGASLVP